MPPRRRIGLTLLVSLLALLQGCTVSDGGQGGAARLEEVAAASEITIAGTVDESVSPFVFRLTSEPTADATLLLVVPPVPTELRRGTLVRVSGRVEPFDSASLHERFAEARTADYRLLQGEPALYASTVAVLD